MLQANSSTSTAPSRLPQPGEIWELRRSLRAPLPLDASLYSEPARRFLAGEPPNRYVMIVHEPEPLATEWQTVLVMLLSEETRYVSPVDRVISIQNQGVSQAVLAQTWHIVLMLVCNLDQPINYRLSRQLYDELLECGDREFVGSPEVLAFHAQEQAWSDVLSLPVAACYAHQNSYRVAERVLAEAVEVEQLLQQSSVSLRQWLEQQFEAQWQSLMDWTPPLAIACRSCEQGSTEEISALIRTVLNSPSAQQQQAARRLGQIAHGNTEAIAALVSVLHHTQDDETLWAAAEALWSLEPNHAAAGVRRVKRMDWGMQIARQAVSLVVAIVQKSNQRIGVFLQVYPNETAQYLPSDLKLILMDDRGQVQRELTARQSDICLQLKLSGAAGEQFSVCLQLGSASITEKFIL